MSKESQAQTPLPRPNPEGEPGWLGVDDGPVFCWYHAPCSARRNLSVLLCDPLGSDRMNLHLAYRHLALALAERGFPVLRLDYPGTCDSAGTPRSPGRMQAWLNALNAGANYLRRRAGSLDVALFGARSGGTLALSFAAVRDDVTHIALWGAYPSGRSHLRNETAFDRMSGSNPHELKPASWQPEDLEASGFLYTGETVDALRNLKPAEALPPPPRAILVMGWEAGQTENSMVEQLKTAGHDVVSVPGPDPGGLSLQRQRVPEAVINTVVTWLLESSSPVGDRHSDPELARDAPELFNRLTMGWQGRRLEEACIRFGAGSELFGILTKSSTDTTSSRPRTAILLVNGGNNHRVGINRNHVEWARHWAGLGFPVLRFDVRGLGDSPPRRFQDLNRLYLPETVSDLTEAADWMQQSLGVDRLVVCGLCAGAYQALHFARRDPRVRGLMLLELLRFYDWEPLMIHERSIRGRLRWLWSRIHPRWLIDRGRIGRWLLALCQRGTKCLVVYREDARMLARFRSEIEPCVDALAGTGNYELLTLGPSNHILSPLWVQEQVTRELTRFVADLNSTDGAQNH